MRILLLIITFIITNAIGQVVNIENQRLVPNGEGWSGHVGLNTTYIKNTSEIWQIGARLRVQYHTGKHTAVWLSELNFVKANKADFLNNGFEHLRYNYEVKDSGRLVLEVFRQMQYNKVRKIKMRSLYGAGLRYVVVNRDSAQVNLGVLPMLEFEDLSTNESNQHFRMSSYLSMDFQFNKNFGLNSISYYQPDFGDFKDFRFSNETSIRTNITSTLRMRVIFRLSYDEFPPEGVPQNTVYIMNGLNYSF